MNIIDIEGSYKDKIDRIKKDISEQSKDRKMIIYSNDLARQSTKFTLEEEKILHIIFSKLNPYGKNKSTVILKKDELFDKLSLNSKSNYTIINDRMSGMIKKSLIRIREDRTNMTGVVISGVRWVEHSELIEVELNPMFMKYIEELTNFYTKIELDAVIVFKSKYTLNLYKFLASWTDEKKHKAVGLTLEETKNLFGLTRDEYVNKAGRFVNYDFERYAVKVAVNEINARVKGWRVQSEKIKTGKQCSGYIFEWIDTTND